MSYWLEEAEESQQRSKHRSALVSRKIEIKKKEISENYHKHKDQYDGFVKTLFNMVRRVNELPDEMRTQFKKLSSASKESKLNNQLYYFSSSRRDNKVDIFSWFKPIRVKHIRVFYLHISRHDGFVNFEIKENFLERKRLKSSEKDSKEIPAKPPKAKDRVHVIFRFPINKLNEETGLQIIDWLVFNRPIDELPIWTETPIEEKQFF